MVYSFLVATRLRNADDRSSVDTYVLLMTDGIPRHTAHELLWLRCHRGRHVVLPRLRAIRQRITQGGKSVLVLSRLLIRAHLLPYSCREACVSLQEYGYFWVCGEVGLVLVIGVSRI